MAASVREQLEEMLKQLIRTDKNGKRDLTGIYQNRSYMKAVIAYLAESYRGKVDCVAAPESLGMILGTMLAEELGVGFLPIRSSASYDLPEEIAVRAGYIDHNDMPRTLQIRQPNLKAGSRVLLADDWINTAATMQACCIIVEECRCTVAGIAAIGIDRSPATERMRESGLCTGILFRE